MNRLLPILAITLFSLQAYAQFPVPDTPRLALPDTLDIVWQHTLEEPCHISSAAEKIRNALLLPDSSVVIGYLGDGRDSFRLARIGLDGNILAKKSYVVPVRTGQGYSSIHLDPQGNITVILRTDKLINALGYYLVIARLNINLEIVSIQLIWQADNQQMIDALVLDDGNIVIGKTNFLSHELWGYVPWIPDPIRVGYRLTSIIELKYINNSGQVYNTNVIPHGAFVPGEGDPDRSYKPLYNLQLKSLTKGPGKKFFATAVNYATSWDGNFNPRRDEDFVGQFSSTGAFDRFVEFSPPGLFSDLESITPLLYSVACRFPTGDSLIVVDRHLDSIPEYNTSIPSITLPPVTANNWTHAFYNQFRFYPQGGIFYAFGRSQYQIGDTTLPIPHFEKYDFTGNRIWSNSVNASRTIPEIARIENLLIPGNNQFIIVGLGKTGKLTIVKLRERQSHLMVF